MIDPANKVSPGCMNSTAGQPSTTSHGQFRQTSVSWSRICSAPADARRPADSSISLAVAFAWKVINSQPARRVCDDGLNSCSKAYNSRNLQASLRLRCARCFGRFLSAFLADLQIFVLSVYGTKLAGKKRTICTSTAGLFPELSLFAAAKLCP